MDLPLGSPGLESDAALLQAAITLGLAALFAYLYQRYRKPYLLWWAIAWGLYVLRLGCIISFVLTGERFWLYGHQVVTGWVALALLWASFVFSRGTRWRWSYLWVVLFPPLWSYIAIYRLQDFLLAAGPAVLFLSLATILTGYVFYRYQRAVGSGAARLLAAAFILWGLHHLDYPFLRARGVWNPWGYYLDILFELAVGIGTLHLILDDTRRGLAALSTLSSDLHRRGSEGDVLDSLLRRPLTLPAVRGTAVYLLQDGQPRFIRGAGAGATWGGGAPPGDGATAIEAAVRSGHPQVTDGWKDPGAAGAYAYAAVLPIFQGPGAIGVLVLVGDARDPFAALDDDFLLALGQQVGAALENADLYRRLQSRTLELERLSKRMVQQHEEERRRLSRELHDETAQVFSAVKMQLGMIRLAVPEALMPRLDRVLDLIDTGIRSIRNVTNDLRPSLLDDLGLLPALRSLAAEFAERSGIPVTLHAPPAVPGRSAEAELALYRALQEALSNVARHAHATRIEVTLSVAPTELILAVVDNGHGVASRLDIEQLEREGHMGLAGMRERIGALDGHVSLAPTPGGGSRLEVRLPVTPARSPAGAAV